MPVRRRSLPTSRFALGRTSRELWRNDTCVCDQWNVRLRPSGLRRDGKKLPFAGYSAFAARRFCARRLRRTRRSLGEGGSVDSSLQIVWADPPSPLAALARQASRRHAAPELPQGSEGGTPGNQDSSSPVHERSPARSPVGSIPFPGGHRRGVTPVPIPNTEVKPSTADGTACESVWESRSLPGLIPKGSTPKRRAFFFLRASVGDPPVRSPRTNTALHSPACPGPAG